MTLLSVSEFLLILPATTHNEFQAPGGARVLMSVISLAVIKKKEKAKKRGRGG